MSIIMFNERRTLWTVHQLHCTETPDSGHRTRSTTSLCIRIYNQYLCLVLWRDPTITVVEDDVHERTSACSRVGSYLVKSARLASFDDRDEYDERVRGDEACARGDRH